MTFRLQRVHHMPRDLGAGVLYVSKVFGTAAHLCACGCGTKIRTPLGPTDWHVMDNRRGPTLFPSVGNWQEPCQSHYLIIEGEIVWARAWTPDEIMNGREEELRRAEAYFAARKRKTMCQRVTRWLRRTFSRENAS
jgi:hypothetical protein